LVVALASWLGRLIARSVGHAARAATTLGKGGPLPSGETPVAEVDTLMAELRGAAARRQAAEDLLRDGKDRLQLALNAAQLGWWQYDPGRGVVSWDMRSKEILDIAEDGTALEEVMKLVHPNDAERVRTAFQTARDPSDPKPYAFAFQVQRGDGEVRWAEVHWLAYFEGAGRHRRAASVVGIVADVPNATSGRNESTSSCARSIIAPRTCSAS
jgi:PAS domain S-box-containing protein